jgi:hypothetical protein
MFYRYDLADWSKFLIINDVSGAANKVQNAIMCEEAFPTPAQTSYTSTTLPATASNYEYFAVWRADLVQIDVYRCGKTQFTASGNCSKVLARQNSSAILGKQIRVTFNHDCTNIIYEIESERIYEIYDLVSYDSNVFVQIPAFSHTEVISSWFIDYEEEMFISLEDTGELV